MVCCEVSILVRAGHSALYLSLFTCRSRSIGLEFLYRSFIMPLVYSIQLCTILSLFFFYFYFSILEAIDLVGYDIADLFFSFTNFDVRIQNSGAVATWTKSWWRYRICNKSHSVLFTFPILFCDENTKVGTIAMSFSQKSRSPK
jgi:hypothetical protein